jgi:hypothetical protein
MSQDITPPNSTLRVSNPLPLVLQRFLKADRSLNDHVEDVFIALTESDQNEKFRAYLTATYPEHSQEGSLAADDFQAARMIREWADTHGRSELSGEKLTTIVKSLNVVLRRYRISRNERRMEMHDNRHQDGQQGN